MSRGNWKDALKEILQNPHKFQDSFYDKTVISDIQNRAVVTIFDKFPKAKYHFLVVPTKIISGFKYLTIHHVSLLEDMKLEAERVIEQTKKRDPNVTFKIGFHAVPSLSQIHMHVISEDFNSDKLKNKKHWNSFTTRFFIDADDFISILENEGAISFDENEYEEILKGNLTCPNCAVDFPTIPKVKSHLQTCVKKKQNNNNNNNNNDSIEYNSNDSDYDTP